MLTLDSLAERPLGRREFWIAVPLRAGGAKGQLRAAARLADTSARELLALPLSPPSADEITEALQAAGKIEEQLPEKFKARRSTVAEQVWIAAHSQNRGLGIDLAAPLADGSPVGGVATRFRRKATSRVRSSSVFPHPLLDEAGQSDRANKAARFDPVSRRYLKVTNLRDDVTSYQVMLALSGSPKGGWDEDVKWMSRIDELGVEADWAWRLRTTPGRAAKQRNKRREANLTDQLNQQEGTAAITGGGGELDEAAQTLQNFHVALGSSEKEVEVQGTLIIAVGGATPEEARDKAEFLRKDFNNLDFPLDVPLGAQEALWWAMWPGVPTERQVKEFTELTTGQDFSALVPLTSSDLGDDKGLLFAENITSGTARPVMLNLEGQIQGDVSGSIGVFGEPGGGKTVLIKDVLGAVHDRGGIFVAIDRTQAREYGTFAESLDPEHTTIADLTEPAFSLDPLRVFGPGVGASHMQTLLSALLGVPARSPGGVLLSELLAPEYAIAHHLTDAGALLAHVRVLAKNDAEAKALAGLMGLYANKQYGAVLFDRELPPLDLTSRGIVFLTHGVALPEEHEINNPDLFKEMALPKLFGRAMYALLISIAREVCFSNKDVLTLFAVDECFHVTASVEGRQELTTFYRDGRKHMAPVLVASQDARDAGDEISRGFIKNRVLMRQTDTDLAIANLEWFHKGFGEDPDMVRMVTEELSPLGPDNRVPEGRRGEGLMRDAQGRMGKIRKTVSLRPERRKATLSTPGKVDEREKVAS
ncbi:ATP-binding protein [Clavibacter nebraskensis]|uniref:ATP-binding protein n=1 Tax=Clavibacter nebraskensis TaxID=31963 RepID=UPI003F4BB5A4